MARRHLRFIFCWKTLHKLQQLPVTLCMCCDGWCGGIMGADDVLSTDSLVIAGLCRIVWAAVHEHGRRLFVLCATQLQLAFGTVPCRSGLDHQRMRGDGIECRVYP